MKAQPCKLVQGEYVPCDKSEATHLTINIPGPSGRLTLPVQIGGTRAGTGNWSWNGDAEKPTLKPSIKSESNNRHGPWVCHTWVNGGKVQFLADSTHQFAGQTLDLLDL